MNNTKHSYESPEVQTTVIIMGSGILQWSLDAKREDYGEPIPVEW